MFTLEKHISENVWNSIKDNYEKGSYTTAITSLVIYIQEVIREKSELEFDGASLMDKAFLGDKPKLLLNKFETRTEKDIQQGIGYILKGICLAIRNPRSHERYNDDIFTANKIILFLDYVLSFLQTTKSGSLVEDWVELLFDDEFIGDDEYLDELYQELPKNMRLDLLINIFRQKENVKSDNAVKFIKKIIEGLNEKEQESLFTSISRDLMKFKSDSGLRDFMRVFPPMMWEKLEKLPRLQIEGKIKECLKAATIDYEHEYDPGEINEAGRTAASAVKHIKYFTKANKDSILEHIAFILVEKEWGELEFILRHYLVMLEYDDDYLNNDNLSHALATQFYERNKSSIDERIVDLMRKKIKYEKSKKWKDCFEMIFDEVILGKKNLKEIEPINDDDLPF